MASPEKPKKNRSKPPRGRPAATSSISQPAVEDASYLTALSSFSPKGNLFAFLSLAVDKHRLRVYDTATGQSVAEHVVDSARVSSLSWGNFDPSEAPRSATSDADEPPNKKKRKKRNSQANGDGPLQVTSAMEVVLLGLSDGTILFFSPTHGRVMRTLSHSTSTAAILSVVLTETGDSVPTTWTSGADGAIRLWNAQKNDILGSWKNDDRIPYSSMAIRPTSEGDRVDVLVANHSIRLLSTNPDTLTEKPTQISTFTGHASSVKQLQWDASQIPPTRFMSMAEGDRIVSVWQTPEGSTTEGKMVASVQLDSDARAISLSVSSSASSERQNLLTLTASGKISIFPIPTELVPPASSSRTQHKVSTLLPRSNLSVSTKKGSSGSQVVDASFAVGVVGHIRVARIVGGVRPVFDLVQYLDDKGDFIPEVVIEDVKAGLINESQSATTPNRRYTESGSVAVRSGAELGQDEEMDDIARNAIDGELDVDLAELSLGQRLTALSGDARPVASSDSDDEAHTQKSKAPRKGQGDASTQDVSFVPASSLTRTLIQALHSSDTKLLETCLAHSDQALIRNTVRRLPPQLAVPLITACVERLGRGARAGNMKGGGGGASSQRATTLIMWVKTVLTVHSGHLMTMPDLVARLSGLHATLSSRLALQDTLLSLSGRLDMVLSQIEMRSSAAPATLAPRKTTQAQGKGVTRYVEGESADEDEQMDVEVEVDSGDDDASVEDVELGGDSSEDEGSEEDDDEDDEDDEMNGFIDDEAEEEYSEEEESGSE
ncbi:U3 small nucleolar RNA-associated protein 5 [Mycena sanguinolenta]|uniref:U3 small nucleolar RNA-associated protein 5 n=1 Tax=Mycena sanguinolenta TaxID=230812 RepID=A0A8H6YY21_9AGAR|nr:U3 small nucleolar RNA-associated protein 5 [Mycena sanguinolenta]